MSKSEIIEELEAELEELREENAQLKRCAHWLLDTPGAPEMMQSLREALTGGSK